MGLTGQKVVVIGGSSGIGFAVAEAAAREGASVAIVSRNKDKLDRAIGRLPEQTQGYQLDATNEVAVQVFFEEFGEFDHLVYTAGEHIVMKPLKDLTIEEVGEAFSIRFWGALTIAKHAAASIRPEGSIVLTSGIVSVRPAPTVVASASASGAIESLTRALAVELAPLRVNAVRLGPVPTRTAEEDTLPNREALFQMITQKLLLKRMGKPSEAAAAYVYLMQGGFTTGTVLTTDGGFVLV